MQVLERRGELALCAYQGDTSLVDMMLVGEQAVGTWVLVFLQTAREVLSEQAAQQINDALLAMQLAMQGETQLDHLFADLIDREPQLPEFLKS
jgi:hydrogenase expression/formation protein HypC